jgi:hypothetical protein
MRKKDPTLTDDQILSIFITDGKIVSKPKSVPDDRRNLATTPPGNDPPPRGEPELVITDSLWEKCILRLVNEAEHMTPQIVDKIRDFLDKKDQIIKKPQPLLPPEEGDLIGISG